MDEPNPPQLYPDEKEKRADSSSPRFIEDPRCPEVFASGVALLVWDPAGVVKVEFASFRPDANNVNQHFINLRVVMTPSSFKQSLQYMQDWLSKAELAMAPTPTDAKH